ncbi:MAG TPA: type II toxin-antitoxin system VapC family toxin [Polyangia bacterium]|jgi:predicted nucleic acid-binding protein
MIAPGDAVFVDTNVLLIATAPARPLHVAAQTVLNTWPAKGVELCVSGQVVREYLAVATRPEAVNGLALTMADARRNIEAILTRTRLLEETQAVVRRLLTALRKIRVAGKRVHDLGIVATAETHGIRKLVTDNGAHFRGLGDLELIDLGGLPEA